MVLSLSPLPMKGGGKITRKQFMYYQAVCNECSWVSSTVPDYSVVLDEFVEHKRFAHGRVVEKAIESGFIQE